jgi:tetratricopeptide (TPR) repeat protein
LRRYLDDLPVRAPQGLGLVPLGKFLRRHRAISPALPWRFMGITPPSSPQSRMRGTSASVPSKPGASQIPCCRRPRCLARCSWSYTRPTAVVESALDYLNRLSAQAARDPELQRELVRGWTRLGDAQGGSLRSSEGDIDAALGSYSQALRLLDAAQGAAPRDQLARAGILRRIADLEAYTRTPAEALVHYNEARAIGESLIGRVPAAELDLAETLMGASRLERLAATAEQAHLSASRAVELLEPLYRANPEDLELTRLRAASLSLKGMAEQRLDRPREALALFEQARVLCEQVASARPDAVSLRREAMLAWLHTGDVLRSPQVNDPAGAIAAYEHVLELGRAIVEVDPSDMRARNEYGNALTRMAGAITGPRRRELYEQARRQLMTIAEAHPDNRTNLFHLAVIEERLGDEHFRAGGRSEAIAWWRTASATARRAANAAAAQNRDEEATRLHQRAESLASRTEPSQ